MDLEAVKAHLHDAVSFARKQFSDNGLSFRRNKTGHDLTVLGYLRGVLTPEEFEGLTAINLARFMEEEKRRDPSLRKLWPGCNVPVEIGQDAGGPHAAAAPPAPRVPPWAEVLFREQSALLEGVKEQNRDLLLKLDTLCDRLSNITSRLDHSAATAPSTSPLSDRVVDQLSSINQQLAEANGWLVELIEHSQAKLPAGVPGASAPEEPPSHPTVPAAPTAPASSSEPAGVSEAPPWEPTLGSRPSPKSIWIPPPLSAAIDDGEEEEEEEEEDDENDDDGVDGREVSPDEGNLGWPMTPEMGAWRKLAPRVLKNKPLTLAIVGGRRKQYKKVMDRILLQTGFDRIVTIPLQGRGHGTKDEDLLRTKLRKSHAQVAVIVDEWLSPKVGEKAENICRANHIRVVRAAKPGQTQAVVVQLLQMFDKHLEKV
jgi:hypothetical protein